MSVIIQQVQLGSLAAKKHIENGDVLISINDHLIHDVLDYQFYATDTALKLLLSRKKDNKYYVCSILKKQYQDIGLLFDQYLMDEQRHCTNKCIFCFIHQMPPGMRESLYLQDDDARLSFLFGNYITLTNLNQQDINRIIEMKLSPINISVHTTNPKLRCEMMGNRFAGERLDFLKQLAQAGILLNCQLVLCPGINDGDYLVQTLEDLKAFFPSVQSIACVPVGLTKYRDHLPTLTPYDTKTAQDVISIVESFAAQCNKQHGKHLAYVSDEFYLRGKQPIPNASYYEDFVQLENGVGLMALFQQEFTNQFAVSSPDKISRVISLATGIDAAPFLTTLLQPLQDSWPYTTLRVYPIENIFFGSNITVAGLIVGADLIAQLKQKSLGDVLLIPDCMLRHQQDCFLDDLTVSDLEKALQVRVKVCHTKGDQLLKTILECL